MISHVRIKMEFSYLSIENDYTKLLFCEEMMKECATRKCGEKNYKYV